jgi:hypothetical protein
MKDNIPILIQQIVDNMLDKTSRSDVRFNYSQQAKNIVHFLNESLDKYTKNK